MIRYLGLSKVGIATIEAARRLTAIATVQNPFNYEEREGEDVLDHCTRHGIGFISYRPLAKGRLADSLSGVLDAQFDPAQLALAWLLRRSPVVIPIPGTCKTAHVRSNVRTLRLMSRSDADGGREEETAGRPRAVP